MTPSLEPFFAGTYFPRNRFKSVLNKIADMWEDDRDQCEAMGKNVIEQLKDMGGSVSLAQYLIEASHRQTLTCSLGYRLPLPRS
jgi:uncharacterized protein YyaL (SSP411 family)